MVILRLLFWLYYNILFFLCTSYYCASTLVFDVFGPGLLPEKIVMPARYFFISLNKTIEFSNSPVSENDFNIEINGDSPLYGKCRVWFNILNRKDSSFIVRYKVYDTCHNLQISIEFRGRHIGNSPYKFQEPVHSEDCYCPVKSINTWLNEYQCGDVPETIIEDLDIFQSIDFNDFYESAVSTFNNSHSSSVCHYVVKNNNVYRTCYGKHVGFKMFMDNILLSLARKVQIPDLEFFSNLGDWPLIRKGTRVVIPLFSWCGSTETLDVVMPTYDITESSLECMGRVSLDMLSVQGNVGKKWSEKIPKAFWRGRDASLERLKLVEIGREHPDLFNVSLTNFFFFRDQQDKYGPKTEHVSFFKFFDYKYQVNMDGTVAAYRFPYLLAGDSLVLKQESVYYEHFYRELAPWEHYVPFGRDLSDLVDRVKWAVKNEEEARRISKSGQKFARENLLPQQIFCYHVHLFNEWSKRLTNEVKIRKYMEHVPRKESDGCDCLAHHSESSQLDIKQEL